MRDNRPQDQFIRYSQFFLNKIRTYWTVQIKKVVGITGILSLYISFRDKLLLKMSWQILTCIMENTNYAGFFLIKPIYLSQFTHHLHHT